MNFAVVIALFALILTMASAYPGVPCDCGYEWEPVCGVDGLTYNNKCLAKCFKKQIKRKGECKKFGC